MQKDKFYYNSGCIFKKLDNGEVVYIRRFPEYSNDDWDLMAFRLCHFLNNILPYVNRFNSQSKFFLVGIPYSDLSRSGAEKLGSEFIADHIVKELRASGGHYMSEDMEFDLLRHSRAKPFKLYKGR